MSRYPIGRRIGKDAGEGRPKLDMNCGRSTKSEEMFLGNLDPRNRRFAKIIGKLRKIHLGIFEIIDKSSKTLLLFDKNLIAAIEEVPNILKNIWGIFSGCFSKTLKNILSKN